MVAAFSSPGASRPPPIGLDPRGGLVSARLVDGQVRAGRVAARAGVRTVGDRLGAVPFTSSDVKPESPERPRCSAG